jgi:drug/metabolite transporter (DMT)-like permease
VLAVAVAWGSSYLAAKEVVAPEGLFAFLVLRFALATVALTAILAPRLRGLTRSELTLGVLFGGILSVVLVLETVGVTMTSASNAGLIISLTVVMTPLLDQCGRRIPLPPAFHGAAAVAVIGVAVLTQAHGFAAPNRGDLLILLAAAARAVHVTMIARRTEGRTVDSGRVTLVQLGTCLSIFATLSQIRGEDVGDVAGRMRAGSWLLVIYLALVCTVFAFLVQTWAVRRASPARVSLLLGTEPLWALIVGMLVARDPWTAWGFGGAMLILVGVTWGRIVDARPTAVGGPSRAGPAMPGSPPSPEPGCCPAEAGR